MTHREYLLAALLAFTGSLLLLRSLNDLHRSGLPARLWTHYRTFHIRITERLIEKGIFRFPGIRLASPIRSWIAGELTFLSFFLYALFEGMSLKSFTFSVVAGSMLGILAVVLSIRQDGKKQIHDVRSGLPLASFLLSLILEAGMGSSAALREVVRALPDGALSRELDEISRSRLLGMSKENAIDRSAMRVPLDEYRLFMNLIRQGERLGVGFSRGFRELSSSMMENQWYRAESLAQKAAVKLLLPLLIFIFPSVFLIVLSPVILNLFQYAGR